MSLMFEKMEKANKVFEENETKLHYLEQQNIINPFHG